MQDHQHAKPQEDPTARSNRFRGAGSRTGILAVVLGAMFLLAGGVSGSRNPIPAGTAGPDGVAKSPSAQPPSEDERLRAMSVGTWHDEYRGKRTMELRADGTGVMMVELSGWTATLFADRLEFDMLWSVEGGRMQKRTVGGRPEEKVRMILKMMGDRVDEPILELTGDRLLLLDADGRTRYDWRRG